MPSRNLSPRQIEAFRAAVVQGSATAAADALFVTQPAISRLLADLEDAVGFSLFERQGRGLQPTTDGLRLYDAVERVYLGLETVAETARAIRERESGKIRIGALPVYADGIVADQVGGFVASHPGIRVELDAADRDDLIDGLLARRFDLAVSTIPAGTASIGEIPLGERQAVCILPPGHPLAAREEIGLEDVSNYPFIELTGTNPFKSAIDQALDRAKKETRVVAAAHTQRAITLMVGAGAGISIVDPDVCRDFAPGGVVVRRLIPGMGWRFGILHNRRATPAGAAARLIEYLKAQFG